MRNLYEALQKMVLGHADIRKLVAEAFGVNQIGKPNKSHWTLYREVNPEDREAKMGVIDAVALMRTTNDHTPLHIMADELGYTLRPKCDQQPNGRDMNEECLQGFEAVHAFIEGARAGQDYRELFAKHEAALKELDDVFIRARATQEATRSVRRGVQ